MKMKEKKVKRVASLVEAGLDEEDAVAQVEEFDNLNDDQFSVFAMSIKKYMKGGKVKAEEDSEAGMHGDKDMKKKDTKSMNPSTHQMMRMSLETSRIMKLIDNTQKWETPKWRVNTHVC